MSKWWAWFSKSRFLPSALPGMLLWYDAMDTASIVQNGSGEVSEWKDKSGNGRHAAQPGSSSLRPVYSATAMNTSRAGLQFNGASQSMGVSNPDPHQGAMTYFMVFAADSTAFSYMLDIAGDLSVVRNGMAKAPFSTPPERFVFNFDTSKQYLASNLPVGEITVAAVRAQNGAQHQWMNAHVSEPPLHQNVDTSGDAGLVGSVALGSNYQQSGAFYDGAIGEVVLYDRFMEVEAMDRVVRYLAAKWGVTLA